jgi:hypothetical protein
MLRSRPFLAIFCQWGCPQLTNWRSCGPIAALHKDLSRAVKAAENKEQAKQAVPRFAATTIEGPNDFCAGYLKRNHRADDEDAAA